MCHPGLRIYSNPVIQPLRSTEAQRNNKLSKLRWRIKGVVPFSVEGVWRNIDAGQFLVVDGKARLVATRVQGGAPSQAGARRGTVDRMDDRPVADHRTAVPVVGDGSKRDDARSCSICSCRAESGLAPG